MTTPRKIFRTFLLCSALLCFSIPAVASSGNGPGDCTGDHEKPKDGTGYGAPDQATYAPPVTAEVIILATSSDGGEENCNENQESSRSRSRDRNRDGNDGNSVS